MIKAHYEAVKDIIRDKAVLCAVTKRRSLEEIREYYDAGERIFAENRAQDLKERAAALPSDIRWQFIGHLQRNKVRQVVGKVSLIQSVDSLRLLAAIDKEARRQEITQDILLEINIGEEESKSGFAPEEILPLLEKIGEYPNIRVKGLMAIPPISQKNGDNLKFFQKMCNISVDIIRKKYDNVMVDFMSMGMSDDFRDAIACGSTMIRVGTAIFGQRDYTKLHQT